MATQTFTTTGSWTAPTGVNQVTVELWGAGGGGAAWATAANGGATGGGAGAYARKLVNVVPGTTYTVTIGAGGIAVSVNNNGNVGGDSWFGTSTTALAKGGSGGTFSTTNQTLGSLPSSLGGQSGSCIGDVAFSGGNSGALTNNTVFNSSGGGAASSSGIGGNATANAHSAGSQGLGSGTNAGNGGIGSNPSNPQAGQNYGGGGGAGNNTTSAAGAGGLSVLTWNFSLTVTETQTTTDAGTTKSKIYNRVSFDTETTSDIISLRTNRVHNPNTKSSVSGIVNEPKSL